MVGVQVMPTKDIAWEDRKLAGPEDRALESRRSYTGQDREIQHLPRCFC